MLSNNLDIMQVMHEGLHLPLERLMVGGGIVDGATALWFGSGVGDKEGGGAD